MDTHPQERSFHKERRSGCQCLQSCALLHPDPVNALDIDFALAELAACLVYFKIVTKGVALAPAR